MKEKWFFEETVPGISEGVATGLKVKKEIYCGSSKFQKIKVLATFLFGKILTLDGIVQLSEKDDFIYHEMLVHPAMFYHSKPKKVLIVGGGDGGALREVLKHPVEKAVLVEIDKKVIEVSKKYFPSVCKNSFSNKRTEVFVEDALKFVKNYKDFFDVIIMDSTDPGEISMKLFSEKFFKDIFQALKKDGLVVVQSGCFFEQFSHLKKLSKNLKKVFPFLKFHKACVPCLQCSTNYSFTVASKFNLDKISRAAIEKKYKKLNLKLNYYTPEIHFASQVLPKYLKEKLF